MGTGNGDVAGAIVVWAMVAGIGVYYAIQKLREWRSGR